MCSNPRIFSPLKLLLGHEVPALTHILLQGMRFLHSSVIESHGYLKSSNCVINNHFSLKIADFSRTIFMSDMDRLSKATEEARNEREWERSRDRERGRDEQLKVEIKKVTLKLLGIILFLPTGLVYRAPELLRMQCIPCKGTKEGDMYSFAIIVHEIMVRYGPFGLSNMECDLTATGT